MTVQSLPRGRRRAAQVTQNAPEGGFLVLRQGVAPGLRGELKVRVETEIPIVSPPWVTSIWVQIGFAMQSRVRAD